MTQIKGMMKYICSITLMLLFTIECTAQFDHNKDSIEFDSLFSNAEESFWEASDLFWEIDLANDNWELEPLNAFYKFFENYDLFASNFGDGSEYDDLMTYLKKAHYYCALMDFCREEAENYYTIQYDQIMRSWDYHIKSYWDLKQKTKSNDTIVDKNVYFLASKYHFCMANWAYNKLFNSTMDYDTADVIDLFIRYLHACDSAIRYYDSADIVFNKEGDIMETQFIEYAFLETRDSIRLNKRFQQIGEYYFYHPNELFEGKNHVIYRIVWGEKEDATFVIDTVNVTVPYVHYTAAWLLDNGRNKDLLDFFDSIYPRFRNDIEIQKMLFKSYYSLGYYGQGLWRYGHWLEMDTSEYSPLEMQAWIYYWNGQYDKAKGSCDNVLAKKSSNIDMLSLRGVCNEILTNRDKAQLDFKKVLSLNQESGKPTEAFVYAMLGKTKDAISMAERRGEDADSLLKQRSFDDSLYASILYYDIAQVYSITGNQRKAKRCIRKALTVSLNPFTLSYALSLPYMETLHEEIFHFVEIHQGEYQEKYGETLKHIEPEMFDTMIICPTPSTIHCTVNGHEVDMLFDTGADKVLISKELALLMKNDGTLTSDDYTGETTITVNADGYYSVKDDILIRSLIIGNVELRNVPALIAETDGITMLFGRSAINLLDDAKLNEKGEFSFQQIRFKR